ncbi:MAG: SDR family oxidoreductase [Proteobacteria bacterium]|nr:SDR family oxidoreductase [Pseudomonadota bacterium]
MTETILITGAARRIGRQLALDLAEAGNDIIIHYNASQAEAEEVAGLVRGKGRQAAIVQAHLADPAAPERLMAAAVKALGPVTVLINNASVFEPDDVGGITLESWDHHLDTNLRAPVMLSQAFARQLPADRTGNIINIVDQRVWKLNPRFFSYTMSKSGLWTATRTLAQALAPRIRVNAIGPGPALPSVRMDEAEFQKQARLTLLGRGTSPREISEAAKFILSQGALTGQMIALDGGQHLVWQTADVVEVKE